LGRYALPVYEVYKAGLDPYWEDGLDLLGRLGLQLAVVPHYNDSSGGENYDSRFCYMGARRFDMLQAVLPPDVTILGIDAYTAITFDPEKGEATVSGQSAVTLIGDGAERRFTAGDKIPFEAFQSSSRGVVQTFDGRVFGGYEFSDEGEDSAREEDTLTPVLDYVAGLDTLKQEERIELLARVQGLGERIAAGQPANDEPLVELILELREALRGLKRYDLADRARKALEEMGFEIGDSPQGATWTRR
jgi:hypothetical protein